MQHDMLVVESVIIPELKRIGGKGMGLWRGPLNGNGREGEPFWHLHAYRGGLKKIDPSHIVLKSTIPDGQRTITGTDCFIALEEVRNHIVLGPDVALAFWRNPDLYPWKDPMDGYIPVVFFDGLVLRNPAGKACTLHTSWDPRKGRVLVHYALLAEERSINRLSALLKWLY